MSVRTEILTKEDLIERVNHFINKGWSVMHAPNPSKGLGGVLVLEPFKKPEPTPVGKYGHSALTEFPDQSSVLLHYHIKGKELLVIQEEDFESLEDIKTFTSQEETYKCDDPKALRLGFVQYTETQAISRYINLRDLKSLLAGDDSWDYWEREKQNKIPEVPSIMKELKDPLL